MVLTFRSALAIAVMWLAGLGAVGCGFAFLFELDPIDTGHDSARPLYLAGWVALAVGCAVGSIGAWCRLLPAAKIWAVPAFALSLLSSLAMVGAFTS